ncbi:hypothetical protein PQX77_021101 [Marasmius sp. AFHP31]|nr:hypothetical protein PQX77_021101 [Marasmius sp. AFHP31]
MLSIVTLLSHRPLTLHKPIQYNEGRVASEIPQDKILLTSPNTFYTTSPLSGLRTIRMRRDFHFGKEDPLFFPQPYIPGIGYLSVIPFPTSDSTSPHSAAWRTAEPLDFIRVPSNNPSRGLGTLLNKIRLSIQKAFDKLAERIINISIDDRSKVESEKSNVKNDELTMCYLFRIKYLLSRLKSLSSYREATLTFSSCQRAYLELVARVDWLETYRRRMYNPSAANRPAEDAKVVSALTGDDETTSQLFLAGIPVWYSQPLYKKDSTRVDIWIPLDSISSLKRLSESGIKFSLDDESPPNPVLFEDLMHDATRYAKMGEYLQRISSTNIYLESAATTPPVPTPPQPSSSGPSRTSRAPYRHHPTRLSGAQVPLPSANSDRDKFVNVASPIMPPPLLAWARASAQAGAGFDPNTCPPPGLNNGYALPDPNIIVGTKNQATQAAFITTWLRLRAVLLYRLRSPTFAPLKPKEWRVVLGMDIHRQKAHTQAAQSRNEIEKMLQECLDSGDMGGSMNLANLSEAPVVWCGLTLTHFSPPPANVAREILWEMFEINFQYELLSLDSRCYRAGLSSNDRKQEVLGTILHFENGLIPSSVAKGREGYASRELDTAAGRRQALRGLLQVMDGWAGGPGQLPRPLQNSAVSERLDITSATRVDWKEVKDIEFAIVHHYVSIFRSIFQHAPLLPHSL